MSKTGDYANGTVNIKAGTGGAGNIGVLGGAIVYNQGAATIEGGNGVGNAGGGAVGSTIPHNASYNNTTQKLYTMQDETTHTGTWTKTSGDDVEPPKVTYGWTEAGTGNYYHFTTTNHIAYMNGRSGGVFAPAGEITRAEFIVIATRFAARVPGNISFTDVPEGYWAHDEIGAAHFYGWVDGYSDGTFKPGANIARSEAVKIVNRMLDRTADEAYIDAHADLKRFPDVEKTYWAFYDIAEATNAHDFEKKNGAETWKAK